MRMALGVTGGVAAYKAAELVRRLQQERHRSAGGDDAQRAGIRHAADVRRAHRAKSDHRTVWRRGRRRTPPTSKAPSSTSPSRSASTLLVIAPATANVLAKLARGIADDFLTTLVSGDHRARDRRSGHEREHVGARRHAGKCRDCCAPAACMSLSPDEGYLACGMTGAGRLAGVEAIAASRLRRTSASGTIRRRDGAGHRRPHLRGSGPGALSHQSLLRKNGLRAGGRGGAARGARGAGQRAHGAGAPAGVECVPVRSAEEMHRAVLANLPHAGIVIMAAAVADYRPVAPQAKKIKRGAGRLTAGTRTDAGYSWRDVSRDKG